MLVCQGITMVTCLTVTTVKTSAGKVTYAMLQCAVSAWPLLQATTYSALLTDPHEEAKVQKCSGAVLKHCHAESLRT